MKQIAAESSGMRMKRLMETQLPQIVRIERKNDSRICLYGTGDYWTAFERSAYRLCQLFPELDTSIVMLRDQPFPVVMASITDEALRRYAERHIFCRNTPDYKEIAAAEIPPMQYFQWHRQVLQSYLPALNTLQNPGMQA